MRKLALMLAAAGVTVAMTAAASAAPIGLTLTGPIAGNTIGPQSSSNPCIICATMASQPAGFGFNNFVSSGSISSYNMYSTTPTAAVADGVQGSPYTVAQINGVTSSNPFDVAIDVNTTHAAGETLQLFEVIDTTTHTTLYNYVGPTLIGEVDNNGNGYADWILGTINLSSLPTTDDILFHAYWTNASDGGESFFIIGAPPSPPPTIPEPLTLSVFGAGLIGAVAMRRRQKKA